MIDCQETDDGIVFNLRVIPNSSKSEIVGEFAGSLKVKIAAPPVGGAANAELAKFLSKKLGLAKSRIEIISGHSSKNKQIKIYNSDPKALAKLIE